MSMFTPDREISGAPRCDRPVQGDGIMSYHCSLPQGHAEKDLADPEPCYSVESSRSARAWDAWKRRREARAQATTTIGCPACGEVALKVDWNEQTARCENCGEVVPFQKTPEQQGEMLHDLGDVAEEFGVDLSEEDEEAEDRTFEYFARDAETLRTREGDQRLPDGDESTEDDQTLLIRDIEQRRQVGIARYRQGHRPFNGRDTLKDLYEEQLDFLVYLRSIVRMAEADREALIEVVGQALRTDLAANFGSEVDGVTVDDVANGFAEVAVDRIMGWVASEHFDHESTFRYVDSQTGVVCPTRGGLLCTLMTEDPGHRHVGAHRFGEERS